MQRILSSLVCLTLLFAACSSTPSEPEGRWFEAEVEAPSDRVLWKIALLSAERMSFPLAQLDPGSRQFVTGWRTNLQPFSGDGDRTRAEVRLVPVSTGRWQVQARVQRQVNKALVAPLDPTRAEWEWVQDDVVQAEILLRRVVSALDPDFEPGEETQDAAERRIRAAAQRP